MIDLEQLEALAKAATQGDWEARITDPSNDEHGEFWLVSKGDLNLVLGVTLFESTDINSRENSEYIAAANPAAILSLIAEVRALRKDKERLDSGRIMLRGWDDFVGDHKIDSRGNNLRQMIDEAVAKGGEG
jgi:hypothetical protein